MGDISHEFRRSLSSAVMSRWAAGACFRGEDLRPGLVPQAGASPLNCTRLHAFIVNFSAFLGSLRGKCRQMKEMNVQRLAHFGHCYIVFRGERSFIFL